MKLAPTLVLATVLVVSTLGRAAAQAPSRGQAQGHDFIAEAKALLVVGACAQGAAPGVNPAIVATHCKKVRATQDAYRTNWLNVARPFFAAHVPSNIPKVVVYPFAGGDLSTALTVFPDADEITTLSLEPAGDPMALSNITDRQLRSSLATVATELGSLYRSNFSVTTNMIGAMRGGVLPTQLIFGLSALALHGFEPVSLRYFQLTPEGDIRYLSDADIATIGNVANRAKRNAELANIELRFRKIGHTKVQVYRHIMANLDDAHLEESPAALLHLQKKGKVAGMTKAASYLLTFDNFKTMRSYLIDHVTWMVSDSTGLLPTYGKPAGFEYETWGSFDRSNMKAGRQVERTWRALFAEQPRRPLTFRFGYPDGKWRGHLVIMRRAAK